VVGKEIAVKKYVVRLSAEDRAQLDELIRKGNPCRSAAESASSLPSRNALKRDRDPHQAANQCAVAEVPLCTSAIANRGDHMKTVAIHDQ
jgi:hypothetical protein